MKIWRKRITSVSGRDNAGSAVFAHTLLAMSLLAGYVVLGMGTAGLLAYTGLHTDPARSPYHRLLVQVCGIACAVVSASTYPAWRRFVATGSKLVRQDQPCLFERMDKVASLFEQHARNQGAFTEYLYREVRPAVGRGYHPPVIEGFDAFLAFAGPRRQPEEIREDPEQGSLSVAERLAAIQDLPPGPCGDPSPAISLLDNVPELETRLLLLEAPSGTEELRSIPWTQAASCSVLPNWHVLCRLHAFKLYNLTLGDLPRTMANLDSYGVVWGPDVDADVARECSKSLFTAALGRVLTREGWYIDHAPGYLRLRRLNHEIDPARLLDEMASPEFTPETWHEMLSRWDLDPTLPLGPRYQAAQM